MSREIEKAPSEVYLLEEVTQWRIKYHGPYATYAAAKGMKTRMDKSNHYYSSREIIIKRATTNWEPSE